MPEFRFAPRALLELGKELISSDEVALYELIKNSVDAGSATITIDVEAILPASAYRSAIELLRTGSTAADVLSYVRSSVFKTTPSARREAFIRPLEETVGNKKAFSESLREIYASANWIRVADTGHGMTLSELDEVYLVVGTRSRRAKNIAGATFLGDKGVGRLSAMRLGDRLTVRTTVADAAHWNELEIDWSLFNHDTVKSLAEIQVQPKRAEKKKNLSEKGTSVTVSHLNADWSPSRFKDMLDGEIARMVDPFDPGKGNRLLTVRYNGERVLVPSIPPKLLSSAHATCKVNFSFDEEDEPQLRGSINYRLKSKSEKIAISGAEVYSIAQRSQKRRAKKGHAADDVTPISPIALKSLGPFSVEIYWYNRAVVEAISGLTTSVIQTKEEIRQWSGGPMLYRRGFRILPYGDPDDDWLELDRRAFRSAGFKLNRQQVIGRVTVSSTHVALGEQTNREGLIESDATHALSTILKWLLHIEFRDLINRSDKLDQFTKRDAEETTMRLRQAQDDVEDSLGTLRRAVGSAFQPQIEKLRSNVDALVNECESLVKKQDKAVAETVDEREKFVHLAGIGLITEFIFHELDRAVNHALKLLPESRGSRRDDILTALEEQLKTLQKRVAAFDELSGEKRQTKSVFDMCSVVENVVSNHSSQFARHSIRVTFERPKGAFKVRAVKGMTIQILENLVVNAVYWLKQQKKYESGLKPSIKIVLDEDDKSLTIEDNGTGIDPSRREKIFQPFVSSKPLTDGGRGLGLYIARELAEYNGWQLFLDEESGRMKKGRLSLFVLDMDNVDD